MSEKICCQSKPDLGANCIMLIKCSCFYCKSCKKVNCRCETRNPPKELVESAKPVCICNDKCICCTEKSAEGKTCRCGDTCRCCNKSGICCPSDCILLCQCACFYCKICKKIICKCRPFNYIEASSYKEDLSIIRGEKCTICKDKCGSKEETCCGDSCKCRNCNESNPECVLLCKCALFYNKQSKKLFCTCENAKCSESSTCDSRPDCACDDKCICCVTGSSKPDKCACGESCPCCDISKTENPNWVRLCKCTGYYCKSCKKIVCKCETYTCPEEMSNIDPSDSACGKCTC